MLPEKFTERMQNMLGAEFEDFLRSFERDNYQALRVNPLKSHGTEKLGRHLCIINESVYYKGTFKMGFPGGSVVKNPPAKQEM